MTSREAFNKIVDFIYGFVYDNAVDYLGDDLVYDELVKIKDDLDKLEYLEYAREHSTEGQFSLPNGKHYSCDMGYVEEFFSTIEKELEDGK